MYEDIFYPMVVVFVYMRTFFTIKQACNSQLDTQHQQVSLLFLQSHKKAKLVVAMRTFALFVTAAFSLLQVSFAAPAIKARDCQVIPSTANAAVRDQVYRITQSRGVTAKVLLSTFEVCESPSTCYYRW